MRAAKIYILALLLVLLIVVFTASVYQTQKQATDKSVTGQHKNPITEIQGPAQQSPLTISSLQPELVDFQYTSGSPNRITSIEPDDTAEPKCFHIN